MRTTNVRFTVRGITIAILIMAGLTLLGRTAPAFDAAAIGRLEGLRMAASAL